ncbi:S53 family peptidase [Micromonospora sp. C28SCA-DRY-2]|nr:S53 family peptidase [Micromonospora sp. C28SCA-DRY-2]MDO3702793.1 S53 family peptidase [Micromonospora sp. C28SCA-DRY-2]
MVQSDAGGKPLTTDPKATEAQLPPGYGVAQLQTAYGLTEAAASKGADQTVAVVVAYDAPNAEQDLAVYRGMYGLPPCTTENGCFRKVNQDGESGPLPPPHAGWALEAVVDLDMVSAACPQCKILLVEANDNLIDNLAGAVATAARLGATQIVSSWGLLERPGILEYETFFDHPGVSIFAASGDTGYGVSYPASSASVTSVGGTSLWPANGARGYYEYAWGAAGSGCSAYVKKPSWQRAETGCSHRATADVSAVADPATAVAVYDTHQAGGWVRVGGTSVATSLVAGVYALIGEETREEPGGAYAYRHPEKFFDITSGNNTGADPGADIPGSCSPAVLCTAGVGYDGPTGVGTPNLAGIDPTVDRCVNNWEQVRTPNPSQINGIVYSTLADVAVLSESDVWTLGEYFEHAGRGPGHSKGEMIDIQHWNGSEWEHVPSPHPTHPQWGDVRVLADEMEFSGPDDGWVVGHRRNVDSNVPHVQHWDGRSWSLSPVLNPVGGTYEALGQTRPAHVEATGVAAISPTDVWVTLVEYKDFGMTVPARSYVEHWDGRTWSFVDFPFTDGPITLHDVYGTASNDVWAVGRIGDLPYTMHWDGKEWTPIEVPYDAASGWFFSVDATGPNDVWAVGEKHVPGGEVPLIQHWDGKKWTETPDGGVISAITKLTDVTAIAPDDVWVAGDWTTQSDGGYVVEHWDGKKWTVVDVPEGWTSGLTGIDASGPNNVWAVGAELRSHAPNGFGSDGFYTYAIRNDCGGE